MQRYSSTDEPYFVTLTVVDWMLKVFDPAGKRQSAWLKHQLWQNGNYWVILYTDALIEQKIGFIHEN